MADKSKIEWTDATWNPITGCTKVSEGCRNCYAQTFAERFRGTPGHYFEDGFDITLRPDKLSLPMKWRRPKFIFVNSMSDLFHEQIPDAYIDEVFGIMLACEVLDDHKNTFQILTKRPERMHRYLTQRSPQELFSAWALSANALVRVDGGDGPFSEAVATDSFERFWPLPNVWLGVSVENQQAADERVPLLLQTPASMRFLSCEPLLGSVELTRLGTDKAYNINALNGVMRANESNTLNPEPLMTIEKIDWVIVGGESGAYARPMHPTWVRSLRDQCVETGVPFFFKGWGEWMPVDEPWKGGSTKDLRANEQWLNADGGQGFHGTGVWRTRRNGKRNAGFMLDGRTWYEYPVEQTVSVKTSH